MSLARRPIGVPAPSRVRAVPRATAGARDEVVEAGAPRVYVGLVTRVLAFAIDAALVNAVAILTTAIVNLIVSVVTVPQQLRAFAIAAAGTAYVLWVAGYFVTFWATTGQTPGSRVLRIRVAPASGGRLLPRRALLRLLGLMLAAIPLFAGFVPILLDDRRRGLHDMLARTVVVEAPRED